MAAAEPAGRAWGWVAALRAGSTAPWSRWPLDAPAAPPTARDLPAVQQLELLRRLNLLVPPDPTPSPTADRARLADRILAASATGRGVPDLELVGAVPVRTWGLPPVDPGALGEEDLLPFAATLLAEDVLGADAAAERDRSSRHSWPARTRALPRRARRRLLRRRSGHQVVGSPWLAWTARDELLRRGRPLGGPSSTLVVAGQDLASLLVDVYTARAFDGGTTSWERWLRPGPGGALPPGADLAAVTRRWSTTAPHARLVVVPDPTALPATLRLPDRAAPRLAPARPSADAVDLARRVAVPLGLTVTPAERRRLLRRVLLPVLLADDHAAAPLAVPPVRLPWVVRRAERVRDDLAAAGYPVVGDLQGLVPSPAAPGASGAVPDSAGVLALALRLLAAPTPTETKERR